MNTVPLKSATNPELIQLLRSHELDLSREDRAVLAARLEELMASPAVPARAKKRRQSRADRYSEAQGMVTDARCVMEELRDELQSWYDNMPENFQSGVKGEALETAVSEIEDAISDCESAEGHDVEFPGMFG